MIFQTINYLSYKLHFANVSQYTFPVIVEAQMLLDWVKEPIINPLLIVAFIASNESACRTECVRRSYMRRGVTGFLRICISTFGIRILHIFCLPHKMDKSKILWKPEQHIQPLLYSKRTNTFYSQYFGKKRSCFKITNVSVKKEKCACGWAMRSSSCGTKRWYFSCGKITYTPAVDG